MKVLGIIAEYNPMHNGHIKHISESKKMIAPDYTVCAMSGFFTQRGEAAIFDKWIRAEHAVRNGIDLVFEIPYVYACNSARYFARGAIDLLNAVGVVTDVSFGAESDPSALDAVADIYLNDRKLSGTADSFLNEGYSYPRAMQLAIAMHYDPLLSDVLNLPNNILAIEYLHRIKSCKYMMSPHIIERTNNYKSISNDYHISATAARNFMFKGQIDEIRDKLPESVFKDFGMKKDNSYQIKGIRDINDVESRFFDLIKLSVLREGPSGLRKILTVDEGLEHRLLKMIPISKNLNEFISNLTSKRYTTARIKRMLMHILTGLTKNDFDTIDRQEKRYLRVLALNERGAELLGIIKKRNSTEAKIITNLSKKDIASL